METVDWKRTVSFVLMQPFDMIFHHDFLFCLPVIQVESFCYNLSNIHFPSGSGESSGVVVSILFLLFLVEPTSRAHC